MRHYLFDADYAMSMTTCSECVPKLIILLAWLMLLINLTRRWIRVSPPCMGEVDKDGFVPVKPRNRNKG